jgi:hypothetical protein
MKWITGAVLVLLLLAFLAGFIAYWRSTNDCGHTAAPANPMKAIVYCDYGVANLKLEASMIWRRRRTHNDMAVAVGFNPTLEPGQLGIGQ